MRVSSVLFALLFATASASAQTIPLTDAEKQFIAAHPVIRLMVDRHYEPADFVDNDGKHSGMAANYLELLSVRTGLRFEPVPLDATQRKELDPIQRGVDGVVLSAITPLRAEYYLSTEALLEFPAYILTRQKVEGFLTPADLNGKKVAVVSGYAVEEYLRANYPKLVLVTVPTTDDGLKAVAFGEVEAFVAEVPVSTYWLEKEGYSNLKIAGETGYMYRLGVTSRKDWPELGSILQKGVASITTEERDAIRRKWLTAPYEPFFRSWRFWTPVLIGAAVLLVGVGLLVLTNQLLRRAVAASTRELAASEALYRTTLEGVGAAVLLVRADGSILFASSGAEGVFGKTPEELVKGSRLVDLLGPDAPAAPGEFECQVARRNAGEPRRVLAAARAVTVRDAAWVYVCHDITDRRRAERAERQRRALESIGLLAGGVAHDFNNMLQVIGGYAQMAGSERASADSRRQYLSHVADATDRASGLTRQLLAIARRRPEDKTAVDVGSVTAALLPLLAGLVGRKVEVNFCPPPAPLAVLSDATQIEQVILNLLVNARDAMPDGGTVTLTWDEVQVPVERAEGYPNVSAGRFVRLRVADTGVGIPDAVRSKIFEPFFTTKEEGQGTGLGLSVVMGVAADAGGFVDVQSEVGKGTTFEVLWPTP